MIKESFGVRDVMSFWGHGYENGNGWGRGSGRGSSIGIFQCENLGSSSNDQSKIISGELVNGKGDGSGDCKGSGWGLGLGDGSGDAN